MAHPRIFDEDDPVLARVRSIALDFPDASEKISHGRPAFFTTKVFCWFGGSLKIDGEWVEHAQSIQFLPDSDERPALLADERFYVPAYIGGSGWMGFDIATEDDLEEATELIEMSYRNTAGPRRVRRLDQS